MAIRLEGTAPDGAGINEQKVNKEGQALAFSITQTELEHESEENGVAYNWSTNSLDLDINETLLLVKNISDASLHIECVKIANGAAAAQFRIHRPTTDVTVVAGSGGSVITGTNLNGASVNVADASAATDETGNALGNTIRTVFLGINGEHSEPTPGTILGKNQSIAIDCITEPGTAAATIIGHYED